MEPMYSRSDGEQGDGCHWDKPEGCCFESSLRRAHKLTNSAAKPQELSLRLSL